MNYFRIVCLTLIPALLQASDAECAVSTVCALLSTGADHDYIGEPVSQLEHMLQAADYASRAGAEQEVIIAALLHDIGHLMDHENTEAMGVYGVARHEEKGADFLRELGFSETVCRLVAGHVNAKRYLVAKDPAYAARLSDASRATLAWQGGPMSINEMRAFEADPLYKQILFLRTCDEQAKDPEAVVNDLVWYRELLLQHLEQCSSR
jgi:phosphonate degradation associated HDIG domain protein